MRLTKLTQDEQIEIAVGRSRKEINWKNKKMSWPELVKKLSVTHRTAETYDEYCSSKKPRQDEIKDIGGFVGGYLSSGRRKPENVVHRQLITLDLDYAKSDMWIDFTLLYGCAACIYSTHKHNPQSPRLRLVLPLDREVLSDEYIAIARRIAGNIGIEDFDHTGFQPSRLMYWPSTSSDGDFVFERQDGPWLCADEVLATYRDWKDSSEWPVSERNYNALQSAIKKQGDPLEKPGVVGAFCRTYSISEAIDAFLSDVYEPCNTDNRYTYKEGSTAAGVIVYDDKFAYSHHGTDPISGKLCNAFDLVRLHKYGLKDEDAREGTPGNKLPSYTDMITFATKDPRVKKAVGAEKLAEAEDAFKEFTEVEILEEPENSEWMGELDMDKKGNYFSTVNNIVLILKNDPKLKGRFALDTFEHREIALKNLPWRGVTAESCYLTDRDDAGLRYYIEKNYGISGVQKISDGFSIMLLEKSFHPVRDYLSSLSWDGEPRVETLFIDYMGAADNEYTRTVTRKSIVACVARIFRPGIKFDNILTVVGKEGIGKSTIIDNLGGKWFSDSFSFHMVGKKEANEQLQGVWLVEIGELVGMRKTDLESIKHFIAKRHDRFRVAFGKRVEKFLRQCVFFASSNNRDFLRGSTGNRRFWPIDTYETIPQKDVFTDLTIEEIDQIWAEAVALFKQGETLYLPKHIEQQAYKEQSEHSEYDERTGLIQRYLDTLLPEDWNDKDTYDRRSWLTGDKEMQEDGSVKRDKVCVAEIWCEALGGWHKDMSTHNTKYIHDIMRQMPGWKEAKYKVRFSVYGQQKGYVRTSNFVVTGSKNVTTSKN